MPTLHETLWNLTVEELRYRLKFIAPENKAVRKAEVIDGIKDALAGGGLRKAWEALDETARHAVAEAVYEAEFRHDSVKFTAKFGRDVEFFTEDSASSYFQYQSAKNSTRVNVFFYFMQGSRDRVIPSDLAERLRGIVPEPCPVAIDVMPEPVAEEGVMIRYAEVEALADLGALLRLAAAGRLCFGEKTGMPSKSALPGIAAVLAGGDWFPAEEGKPKERWHQEIGPIKPVGWTRMLHAAGLVAMKGSKSALTLAGRGAVEKPVWEAIGEIWRKWGANKEYDEFHRIDVIKGQSVKDSLTARVPRRRVVLEALATCPAGEWICFDSFSHYMRAAGFLFEVSPDPRKLYIADREYGALSYARCSGWDVLQDRYLLCFLMEHAAPLGLVDIAYKGPDHARPVDLWCMDGNAWLSRYDGLKSFRITPLGKYVLDGGKSAYQPALPAATARLTVLGNRTIRVAAGNPSPAECLQLEMWAEPDGAGNFRLDEIRAIEAVEGGQDPDGFARFLEERDDQPLPETVTAFLRQARENGGAVRQSGPAILFECRDVRTADMIAASKELFAICLRAGEATIAVREEGLARFRTQIRKLGLGIR